mmetsp:Transcript_96895/g.278849  ORF Transcript_96895/g.278849 Transcript_96895/m.278849 type:complete len:487 (+) Transcript_96895:395-1855(+)
MHTAGVRSVLVSFSNADRIVSVIVVLSKISKIRLNPIRTCTFTFTTVEFSKSCSIRGRIWSFTWRYSNFLCKYGTFSRTSFKITGSCSSKHRNRNGRRTACCSDWLAKATCKSNSLRKSVTTSMGISLAVYNGLSDGQILAWKCAESETFSRLSSEMMMGTTTPYKVGNSSALHNRGSTRSRSTRCEQRGDCMSVNSFGRPLRKVTRCVSSFSFSCSRKRMARKFTSMKNSELMKAAIVGRSVGFTLSTLISTEYRSAGTELCLTVLGVKPRGADRSKGWRSEHISSYVIKPSAKMSDSKPHLHGMLHISGAAYLCGGSWLSSPGLSAPGAKAKGQSTSWPHCTPLTECPRLPSNHLPCGSMNTALGDRLRCAVLASWCKNCTASAKSSKPHFISRLDSSCRLFSSSWATVPTTGFVAKANVLRSSLKASMTLRICGCLSRCRLVASFRNTSRICSLVFFAYFSTCFFSKRKMVSLSSGLSLKLAL